MALAELKVKEQDLLLFCPADHHIPDIEAFATMVGIGTSAAKVHRPWGWYGSLDVGERFQVKCIGVKPGRSFSLQKLKYPTEHWIVIKSTAEVTRGGGECISAL